MPVMHIATKRQRRARARRDKDLDMQIALIGGTGGMGTFILEELLSRGHDIKAVVRKPGAISTAEHVTPVQADVYDTAALSEALRGADAVISAFNPGWNEPGLYEKYLLGARSVQGATAAAGVERLLVIGGASSLYSEDGKQLIESFTPPEPYGSGVRAARDYHQEILTETRLDWVFLSPPMDCGPMGPDGRTGSYRTGTEHPVVDKNGKSSLSRQDLALAVADEIERPAHHRQRFTVGY
jgi:putative NADH-flavin reductase